MRAGSEGHRLSVVLVCVQQCLSVTGRCARSLSVRQEPALVALIPKGE